MSAAFYPSPRSGCRWWPLRPRCPPLTHSVFSSQVIYYFLTMSLADLNFDRGQDFAAEVLKKWGVTINYEEGKDMEEFILVAEFTRSRISLTEESVSTILLSCFGARASLYKVSRLQNWSFKFSISSKGVGFSIIKRVMYLSR